jgi:hypothetical protein
MATRSSCYARQLLLPCFITGVFALPLLGQAQAPDSQATGALPRRNLWGTAGFGVGTGGVGWIFGGWYGANNLVIGYRHAYAAPVFGGSPLHDRALLLGVRKRGRSSHALIAGGPARLGGSQSETTTDSPNEIGGALSAEVGFITPLFGFGFDIFASRSRSMSLVGATVSVQVGWFGNPP